MLNKNYPILRLSFDTLQSAANVTSAGQRPRGRAHLRVQQLQEEAGVASAAVQQQGGHADAAHVERGHEGARVEAANEHVAPALRDQPHTVVGEHEQLQVAHAAQVVHHETNVLWLRWRRRWGTAILEQKDGYRVASFSLP